MDDYLPVRIAAATIGNVKVYLTFICTDYVKWCYELAVKDNGTWREIMPRFTNMQAALRAFEQAADRERCAALA